jgi:hypothetical protein
VRVLFCAAIVAALVSFIACTSPAADTKNEVTPTTTVAPKPGASAKNTTVTVPISAVTNPEADSRQISAAYGQLHLDYFEIYFRNSVGDDVDTGNDGHVFIGKARKGETAISINITDPIPEGGVYYDVLLLGGKEQAGGAILMANAYTPDVLIIPHTQNTVTLDVLWLTSRVMIKTTDLTAGADNTDFLGDLSDTTGFTTFRIPQSKVTADLTLYPIMTVNGMWPLYRAWKEEDTGDIAATLGGGWVTSNTAKYWFDACGNAAETNWTIAAGAKRYAANFTSLKPWFENGFGNVTTFIFNAAAPLTVSPDGSGSSPDIKNVLNTFGRLYAVVPIRPMGARCKGVTWYIQGGAQNYYHLQETTGPGANLFGGLLIAFGGTVDALTAGGNVNDLPLTDLVSITESEQIAINIIMAGL